jgi:hypothetical protein
MATATHTAFGVDVVQAEEPEKGLLKIGNDSSKGIRAQGILNNVNDVFHY